MSYSREERLALCALLDKTGPDAPTLCEGWTTGDLAAHLVLREHRPDAAPGVIGGLLAGYTERVQKRIKARTPFPELVRIIRSGPPRLSPMAIPGVDERANAVEFFVHHVIGSPAELTMWVMGRTTAARVRLDGTQPAVSKLAQTNWRRT